MSDPAPTPEEEFDLLLAEINDRMQEYMVALHEIPNVVGLDKATFMAVAERKRGEIAALHTRMDELVKMISANPPKEPSRAAKILKESLRAVGWSIESHNDARAIINECRQEATQIKNPVARASAIEWLRRALRYAEADRRAQAMTCIRNAKSLMNASSSESGPRS